MVFGIMKRINLAHGDMMILASYLSLFFSQVWGLHPLVTLLLVLPALFAFGYLILMGLFNQVLSKGMEPFLMVSFGLSIISAFSAVPFGIYWVQSHHFGWDYHNNHYFCTERDCRDFSI
jgi:branched-subunit amino acid ABC-type transport system permease component